MTMSVAGFAVFFVLAVVGGFAIVYALIWAIGWAEDFITETKKGTELARNWDRERWGIGNDIADLQCRIGLLEKK